MAKKAEKKTDEKTKVATCDEVQVECHKANAKSREAHHKSVRAAAEATKEKTPKKK